MSLNLHSVQFSRSVMSDSLRPHEAQHARSPCPSPTPGAYSNSCPSKSPLLSLIEKSIGPTPGLERVHERRSSLNTDACHSTHQSSTLSSSGESQKYRNNCLGMGEGPGGAAEGGEAAQRNWAFQHWLIHPEKARCNEEFGTTRFQSKQMPRWTVAL